MRRTVGQRVSSLVRRALTDRDRPLLFQFAGVSRFVPLILCGGFFGFTVLWSAIGPVQWDISRPGRLYGFLVACIVALTGGYVRAVLRKPIRTSKAGSTNQRVARAVIRRPARRVQASALVIAGSLIYLLLYPALAHAATGDWLPNVWRGLTDAGAAYANKQYHATHSSQLPVYLSILVAPLTICVLPLTLYFFPRLSTAARVLGIVQVTAVVALGVAQGVNKEIADLAGYLVLFVTLAAATSGGAHRMLRVVSGLVLIAVVCGAFLAYYNATISSRVAADIKRAEASRSAKQQLPKSPPVASPAQSTPVSTTVASSRPPSATAAPKTTAPQPVPSPTASSTAGRPDENLGTLRTHGFGELRTSSLFYRLAPASMFPIGVQLTAYLTQGYQGLSLAMDEPFMPTWGLGFSAFYRHNILRVLGMSAYEPVVEERTYEGQINAEGWPAGNAWSTFFIHPASDITFAGVVVLMFLIGLGFGTSWRDTCQRADPLAAVVFVQFCVLVTYLPANNQLFQGGVLAVGFPVVLAAWLLLRRRNRPIAVQSTEAHPQAKGRGRHAAHRDRVRAVSDGDTSPSQGGKSDGHDPPGEDSGGGSKDAVSAPAQPD